MSSFKMKIIEVLQHVWWQKVTCYFINCQLSKSTKKGGIWFFFFTKDHTFNETLSTFLFNKINRNFIIFFSKVAKYRVSAIIEYMGCIDYIGKILHVGYIGFIVYMYWLYRLYRLCRLDRLYRVIRLYSTGFNRIYKLNRLKVNPARVNTIFIPWEWTPASEARVNMSHQFLIMKIRNMFTLAGFTFILFCFEKVIFNGISFFLLNFLLIFLLQKMSHFEPKCHIYDMFVTFFLFKCHLLKL